MCLRLRVPGALLAPGTRGDLKLGLFFVVSFANPFLLNQVGGSCMHIYSTRRQYDPQLLFLPFPYRLPFTVFTVYRCLPFTVAYRL